MRVLSVDAIDRLQSQSDIQGRLIRIASLLHFLRFPDVALYGGFSEAFCLIARPSASVCR